MDKDKLVKMLVSAWKDGNSQYHNTKGSVDYDADLECFLEDYEDDINEMCGGIYANASENTLPIASVNDTLGENEVRQLLYTGETNDKSVILDDGKRHLTWAIIFMFAQLNKDIKTDVEALFWKRITALANYR